MAEKNKEISPIYTAIKVKDGKPIRGQLLKGNFLNKGKYYICPRLSKMEFCMDQKSQNSKEEDYFMAGPYYEIVPETRRRVY